MSEKAAALVLSIEPVFRHEDGGTGDRWCASLTLIKGTSADYDGSGATIEEALAALILQMAEALRD